ncbi:MAG TPA: Asd/ArgC dimerization domain-containing protein [Candidatus Aquilonibacter sp.]|nr:Asd/ArgC dimerization domain-containing protein [Candidatus Aquilonibacter sp.]
MANNLRAVIIGASTLLGKELIEELNNSSTGWDLRVAEAADAGGQLIAGGDEAMIVQPLTPDVFDGQDVAFFAESASSTRAHWREAQAAKAAVVDLTSALVAEPRAIVRSPWIDGGNAPDAQTTIVIPAHPAAVMLALVGSRLTSVFGAATLAATVLEPASQLGARGMDELHQQTVNLLAFHSLPQEVYDAQVAFNLQIALGEAAKPGLDKIAEMIGHDLRAIAGETVASAIAMQLVQAPVFHGYTMSVFAQLPENAETATVRDALLSDHIKFAPSGEGQPSNQSVAQETDIGLAVREDAAWRDGGRGYWLWMAADNLKLAARHAVACAEELCAIGAAREGAVEQDG